MIAPLVYAPIVQRALLEDLAAGDLTTEATVDPGTSAQATAVARTALVVCGADVFFEAFRQVDASVQVHRLQNEGQRAEPGTALWRVQGQARSLLMAERVALNFAQRMSGIATMTRAFVERIPEGHHVRITDTRKTTPGLRVLERYAVRVGGGHNHRDNLGSAVLIKDNHIAAAGGITRAVQRARERAAHTCRIEVEVDNLQQLEEALQVHADIIMLDNFSTDQIHQAVERARGKAMLEVSGRVSLDRIDELARCGIDIISVGALTHSAPSADIALDLEPL